MDKLHRRLIRIGLDALADDFCHALACGYAVKPGSGDEKIPVFLGHGRRHLARTSRHSLGVQPAVPERGQQRFGQFSRALGRVQLHRLPDAPEAYGAMITRAKAAPGHSRSADLVGM